MQKDKRPSDRRVCRSTHHSVLKLSFSQTIVCTLRPRPTDTERLRVSICVCEPHPWYVPWPVGTLQCTPRYLEVGQKERIPQASKVDLREGCVPRIHQPRGVVRPSGGLLRTHHRSAY